MYFPLVLYMLNNAKKINAIMGILALVEDTMSLVRMMLKAMWDISRLNIDKHRFQTALGGRIGEGSSQSPSNGVFIFDFYAKLGLNIASASTPLFINVFVEDSTYNGKIKEGSDLSRDFILLGLEADGYIPLSRLTYFDYGIGYGWIGSANYILNDTRFKVQGKNNESFQAHIGFSRHINDNTLYYINLIGKYQRTNATNTINNMSYPHSRDMIIMLEVGIKGFDK